MILKFVFFFTFKWVHPVQSWRLWWEFNRNGDFGFHCVRNVHAEVTSSLYFLFWLTVYICMLTLEWRSADRWVPAEDHVSEVIHAATLSYLSTSSNRSTCNVIFMIQMLRVIVVGNRTHAINVFFLKFTPNAKKQKQKKNIWRSLDNEGGNVSSA